MTDTRHMIITTPEIHRAIIFFNYCFPEYRIQVGYNVRVQSFYAYSESSNVDFSITHNLRNKIKQLINNPIKQQLKEAKQTLINAQEAYNKLVNDINEMER